MYSTADLKEINNNNHLLANNSKGVTNIVFLFKYKDKIRYEIDHTLAVILHIMFIKHIFFVYSVIIIIVVLVKLLFTSHVSPLFC